MVKTIVESNGRIKEMEKKWSDVLEQNLKNIDKNKEIAVKADEKRLSNSRRREQKNIAIFTGVSQHDDITRL